jgi:hypothetical protein
MYVCEEGYRKRGPPPYTPTVPTPVTSKCWIPNEYRTRIVSYISYRVSRPAVRTYGVIHTV